MKNYESNTDVLLYSMAWNPTSWFIAKISIIVIIAITAIYFISLRIAKKRENSERANTCTTPPIS
jgi:hypothetical protein